MRPAFWPVWFLLAGGSLRAQTVPVMPVPAGSLTGTVIAAESGLPIPDAVVALEPLADAALVTRAGGFFARSLITVTDGGGAYRFAALPAGAYRLIVRHLGYRPASVQVDLADTPLRVSVGLVVTPIQLEAVDARAPTADPYGRLRTSADEARFGDLMAEQFRDQKFLESDAAVLTHADVAQAVTLGETDLFRAAQRLPGVSARDDYTAALWTRGAPWSETRVYLDGLPLFNPVHAIGLFAGLDPDAVGAASFHPGARSVAIGEGAAGVLDVTTRRPERPGLSGLGELSVVSARGAADWRAADGGTSLMLAARRSWVDLATRLAETLGADSGTYLPYDFFDVTGRFDTRLTPGTALEASGLWEQDDVRGTLPGLLRQSVGHWGNHAARLGLVSSAGPLLLRPWVGVTDFDGSLGPQAAGAFASTVPVHAPTTNRIGATLTGLEVSPSGAPSARWSAGLQLASEHQHFVGPFPRPYPEAELSDTLRLDGSLPVTSLWGQVRAGIGSQVALELGLRADMHRPVRNAAGIGLAPKLALRATPRGTHVTFSAALQRSWQYSQALAPAGPSIGPDLYATDVWLLADDTIPAVRSDLATLGVELWPGADWTASINVYGRHATGVTVPEPSPGILVRTRPVFVSADNRAQGVEVSLRRIVGRWTASLAYSYGTSTIADRTGYAFGAPYSYPSQADRRHVLSATAMARVGASWRAGAALTAMSGAPFSRFLLGVAPCDATLGPCPAPDSVALVIEAPNAERAPGYLSLDLMLDWSHTVGRVQVGAYAQLRNVLNRANAVTYLGSVDQCTNPHPPTLVPVSGRAGWCDQFNQGMPLLPMIGVRVAF